MKEKVEKKGNRKENQENSIKFVLRFLSFPVLLKLILGNFQFCYLLSKSLKRT